MIDVAIVGASGYGGGELLRLLAGHPNARVRTAVSETYAGQPVSASFAGLAKRSELVFSSYGDGAEVAQCDVVFLAQENGKAMHTVPHLLEAGCKVVDLSADFRLRDVGLYATWYKATHVSPEWNAQAVYGLPERNREAIKQARLVGNPGCFPTASLLALLPLFAHGIVDPASILIDAKSGVSGAGRSKWSQAYHFPEANENVSAYNIAGTHRHTPEIEQALTEVAGQEIALTFTPHLIPMTRGILATCYATLNEKGTREDLLKMYSAFYADAPFVAVREDLPTTKQTLGSNMCHLGLAVDARLNRVTVVSVIDNLVKGMAGQAIQNMNLMCGFEETDGLTMGGVWP
jgi:N-acetyl-gamma-glutamyl-phosphate reductase